MEHIPLLHLPVMEEEPVSKQTSREDNDLESKAKEPEDKKDNKIAKEIQGDLISQDGSFEYRKFNGYRVLNAYYGEKVKTDLRVIREKGDKNKASEDESLGTIVDVDYKAGEVKVQWDKNVHESPDTFRTDKHNQYELLLFDNAQSGVKHEHFSCDDCKQNPLLGIRWKCLICADYNLCTKCYITDRHDTEHIFYRLICPNSKSVQMPPRPDKVECAKAESAGILTFSTVQLRSISTDSKKNGIVKYYTNNRSTVGVQWKDKFEGNQHDEIKITDLVLKDGGKFRYYPDHLPILVQSADDYFEVDVHDCKPHEKIEVRIWHNVQNMQKKKKRTFKPTLYLIFANPWNDDNVKNLELMGEIIDFAKTTKLPCHIIGQRVLFHSGSTTTVCIHYKTHKDTINELIVRGFKTFQRGDIIVDENEKDEIDYFKKMASYSIGEDVLPVIISMSNGVIQTEVRDLQIPIIRLMKNTQDVSLIWPREGAYETKREHKTDTRKPWRIKTTQDIKTQDIKSEDEIILITDIRYDNVEALVCYLIIAGYLKETQLPEKNVIIGPDYLTALSIYLLKKQIWKIPKKYIGKTFDQTSLEYIHEQVMTADFIEKLWSNQNSFLNIKYKPPKYDFEKTDSEDYHATRHCCFSRQKNKGKKERRIDITKWDYECYGLVFFALLQKQYWSGATQLIEKGYIRIHHILFGCVLLEDEANSWKTSKIMKEKLQHLKSAFTESAIIITSCIYEADVKAAKEYSDGKKIGSKEERTSWNKVDIEFGDCINHSGRLLINHGLTTDAIVTENNTFLENETVQKILNKTWYGSERVNCQAIFIFTILAAVHLFVLPLLMLNMEAWPLLWFYKKYKLPFMKVLIHMLGFLVLLNAYAYMLLFDYGDDGITNSDCFIIALIASFAVDEIKQVTVAILRGKIKRYTTDMWNVSDWLFIMGYATGMILRAGEGIGFQTASKCLLVVAFMLLCIRILNLCCMTEFLGPKLVIIKKMIKDTIAFMIIMAVITVWFSVSNYALLYPNSQFSLAMIETILSNGVWMLFGELNLDADSLTVPHCSFNRTIYESEALPRCPTQLGLRLTPYLKAFYCLIAVILLLNLLIAIYSDSYNSVQQKSGFYWRQIQNNFLEEYCIKTIFPIHLQLLALPGTIISLCYYYQQGPLSSEEKLNNRPMVVRVFLYNTNYDLRLNTTKVAEENGTMHAKGKIDPKEFDAITRELDSNNTDQETTTEKDDKRISDIMNKLDKIDDISKELKEIKSMLETKAKYLDETIKSASQGLETNMH
ncbi:Hypothetical predicted protein [Mytilus galloprovincialis]|uniref:ZZ-type domain-containing protein n=2 Tax=Mytilus galloprovincialis TaxID=29158 RepID=A0A8B6BY83_MYTGA|nr:Hypothetical predicted protein [Mytilus galloprovincialis]